MASYTIANEQFNQDELRNEFEKAKEKYNLTNNASLNTIFEVALNNPSLFPGKKNAKNPAEYIDKWTKGYCDTLNNPPSKRKANPKTACTDPIIKEIIKASKNLTDEEATFYEAYHNLSMSAENIQGGLLEEYISTNIADYGFSWCCGETLRATDFCNEDGSVLLQVKNKSNTENSSSSNIREGTDIQKWYRVGTKSVNKIKVPCFKWDGLNKIVNDNRSKNSINLPPCSMSEEKYEEFVAEKVKENPDIITAL